MEKEIKFVRTLASREPEATQVEIKTCGSFRRLYDEDRKKMLNERWSGGWRSVGNVFVCDSTDERFDYIPYFIYQDMKAGFNLFESEDEKICVYISETTMQMAYYNMLGADS